MRGTAVQRPGSSARPRASASLRSGGYSAELWCMGSSVSSVATLTTNSPLRSMLRAVSFSPGPRRPMLTATIGGLWAT